MTTLADLDEMKRQLSQINHHQQSKARDWTQQDRHMLSTHGINYNNSVVTTTGSVPSQSSYFNAAALCTEKE